MREIKFRAALNAGNNEWVVVPATPCFDVWYVAFNCDNKFDGEFEPNDDEFIPLQYTGLKDINGKEIYEGDILTGGAVVEYFDDLVWDSSGSIHSGFYCEKWTDENSDYTEMIWHYGFRECEVIGNIYENPELIG